MQHRLQRFVLGLTLNHNSYLTGTFFKVIVERSVSSSVSDVEAMSRELALYRSQSSDPQVNQFISMVAKDCKLFNRLRSSTFSETVLWTFVADHSVESQVKEIQRLKSALRLSKEEVEFLQAQIERLQKFDLPVELTNAGTESDNNTTVDVMKERVRVYEQEKVEGALNYEKLSALYAECSGDLDRMLTEHQDVVQVRVMNCFAKLCIIICAVLGESTAGA